MILPVLPDCRLCDLHATCRTVGLPSLKYPGSNGPATIVFLGHQPGLHEDKKGEVFVGPSGEILRRFYIEAINLHNCASIYLMNLVRCLPPGDKPKPTHIRACHAHLSTDIAALSEGTGPRLLVCLGAEVSKAFLGLTLSQALRRNGEEWNFAWLPAPWHVFSTYHPAFLLPHRNPNAIYAVADHLQLVCDHLTSAVPVRSSPHLISPRPPVPSRSVCDTLP